MHVFVLTLRVVDLRYVFPSGEVTLAFVEWCNIGKKLYQETLLAKDRSSTTRSTITPRRNLITPIVLGPEFPRPRILAADPVSVPTSRELLSSFHLSLPLF